MCRPVRVLLVTEESSGDNFSHLFGELVRVTTECWHHPQRCRCSSVAEQVHKFMDPLWIPDMKASKYQVLVSAGVNED